MFVVDSGSITLYAGLLVIPPAIIRPWCNPYFFPINLYNMNPQNSAEIVIIAPYSTAFMLSDTVCIPDENPVPAKNSANPNVLKIFKQSCEINWNKGLLQTMYPISNPLSRVLAVAPNEIFKNDIFALQTRFPKNAVKKISINSVDTLL